MTSISRQTIFAAGLAALLSIGGHVLSAEKTDVLAELLDGATNQVTKSGTAYKVVSDIRYAGTDGAQLLDLYMPSGSSDRPRPAVMLIHGGGWAKGDKAESREKEFAALMMDEGYVAVSINYMLSVRPGPVLVKSSWPQNIYDCKSALRWLKKNAEELGIDPDRIAVMGGSAGGHLALLTGLSADDPQLNSGGEYLDQDNSVRCIVDFYGIPDVRRWGGWAFIAEKENEHPEIWAKASPVEYLSKKSPPILIVHGTKDKTVNIGLSDEFAGILTAKGLPFKYVKVEGAGHSFGLHPPQQDVTEIVRTFLKENFHRSH
ncbi:MAG: alpha/beta hydrolase fold domain-containing protein [Kiritimatiellales bacterium]